MLHAQFAQLAHSPVYHGPRFVTLVPWVRLLTRLVQLAALIAPCVFLDTIAKMVFLFHVQKAAIRVRLALLTKPHAKNAYQARISQIWEVQHKVIANCAHLVLFLELELPFVTRVRTVPFRSHMAPQNAYPVMVILHALLDHLRQLPVVLLFNLKTQVIIFFKKLPIQQILQPRLLKLRSLLLVLVSLW